MYESDALASRFKFVVVVVVAVERGDEVNDFSNAVKRRLTLVKRVSVSRNHSVNFVCVR